MFISGKPLGFCCSILKKIPVERVRHLRNVSLNSVDPFVKIMENMKYPEARKDTSCVDNYHGTEVSILLM